MFQLARTAIPIAAVAGVALDLVEHRMNPRGGLVGLIFLHDAMGGIPLAAHRQFDGFEKVYVQHDLTPY